MHMREKGKRPLLLKRAPSGRESRASCQGTTFHFPDMRLRQERGGGGAAGCVRQQVRLGLPCQEVGRACGSYLIYGRAGAQRPTLTFSERQKEGKKSQRWRWKRFDSSPTAHLIYSPSLWTWGCVCPYAGEHTHTHIYCINPSPHSAAAKGEVTGAAISIQPVGEKVSNEENAASQWTLTAAPSLSETRPHMVKTNTAAQTCKLAPHTQERERERERFPWKCNLHYFHFHGPGH